MQRKKLRVQAHTLKSVVTLDQSGFSETVLAELKIALDQHELIKVRIRNDDRDMRKQISEQIVLQTQATLIQCIGQIGDLLSPQ